jgi:hypothetical protein
MQKCAEKQAPDFSGCNSRPDTGSLQQQLAIASSSFDILEALFHNAVTRLVGGSIMADRVSHALKALDVPG